MFYNAKGGTVCDIDYISFGKGKNILVMLPGLGDGLATVKGKEIFFAMTYKKFAENFKVYLFSRKNHLKNGYSTRDMAKDQVEAMKMLGISKANIIGVSQGGMIAQYIAIDNPNFVRKLVLAVTLSKQNEIVQEAVSTWMEMARNKNYRDLIIDTAEKSYSEKYLKKIRFLYPILSRVGKPKSFNRFLIQASSCVEHNAYQELGKIKCPTLVIGGSEDKIVGVNASAELAEKIQNSELFIYEGLGHAAYEEAKDFNTRILRFLQ